MAPTPPAASVWNRPLLGPALLCLAYTAAAALLFSRMGYFAHLEDVAFSAGDARGYRAIADFLAGHAPSPDPALLEIRPLFFPLLLASYHWVGVPGFLLWQWLLNLTTLAVTFLTLRRLTGNGWSGVAGAGLLALHPTFGVIALHALPESLSLALVALAVSEIVRWGSAGSARSLALAGLFLGASACTKPVYLPFCVAWLGYAAWRLFRGRPRAIGVLAGAVAVSPLVVQLALSALLSGHPGISTAGRVNFEERFFPAVYGFAAHAGFVSYDSRGAREAQRACPTLGDKLRFVSTHPIDVLRAVSGLLASNLVTAEAAVSSPDLIPASRTTRLLEGWSRILNAAMALVHAAVVVLLVGMLPFKAWRVLPGWTLFLAAMALGVLLSSVLTYWQGDRLLLAAVPIWAVAYPAMVLAMVRARQVNR